jgi:hypothetical protein
MPFNKATLHGPNRAANLKSTKHWDAATTHQEFSPPRYPDSGSAHPSTDCTLTGASVVLPTNPSIPPIRVKSMNGLREEFPEISLQESYGHVGLIRKNNGKATEELLKQHCRLTAMDRGQTPSTLKDPLLIHFHDIPVYILRVIFLEGNLLLDSIQPNSGTEHESDLDWIYLSEVQLYNHKICGAFISLHYFRLMEQYSLVYLCFFTTNDCFYNDLRGYCHERHLLLSSI